jgi:thiosulfate dehydrogenase [quinone] large subunit
MMSNEGERRLAYVLLRVSLGMDFLGHGAVRLLHGVGAFAAGMVKQMAETPLPAGFVHGFGLVLPVVELTLGVALLLGLLTRWALIGGALLMLVLMFGVTLRQDWATAGMQLIYCFLFALLLFLRAEYDAGWPDVLLGC